VWVKQVQFILIYDHAASAGGKYRAIAGLLRTSAGGTIEEAPAGLRSVI
jgi:hypothetical protein